MISLPFLSGCLGRIALLLFFFFFWSCDALFFLCSLWVSPHLLPKSADLLCIWKIIKNARVSRYFNDNSPRPLRVIIMAGWARGRQPRALVLTCYTKLLTAWLKNRSVLHASWSPFLSNRWRRPFVAFFPTCHSMPLASSHSVPTSVYSAAEGRWLLENHACPTCTWNTQARREQLYGIALLP